MKRNVIFVITDHKEPYNVEEICLKYRLWRAEIGWIGHYLLPFLHNNFPEWLKKREKDKSFWRRV